MSTLFLMDLFLLCVCLQMLRKETTLASIFYCLFGLVNVLYAVIHLILQKEIWDIGLLLASLLLFISEYPKTVNSLRRWKLVKRGEDE